MARWPRTTRRRQSYTQNPVWIAAFADGMTPALSGCQPGVSLRLRLISAEAARA